MSQAGIIGYTFCAEMNCGACVVEKLIDGGELAPAARDMNVEEALDQMFAANAIDREAEYTYDSDEWPKVALRLMVGGYTHCDNCGEALS